jgi:acylphosphatase
MSQGPKIQRHVWVSGRVQGVGFRASTVLEADRVAAKHGGIQGFVRNLPDGRVEALFSGPEAGVLEIVAWCRQGPRSAEVSRLEVKEEPVNEALPGFGVDD